MEDGTLAPSTRLHNLGKGRRGQGLSSGSMIRMGIKVTKRVSSMGSIPIMKTMILPVQRYNNMDQW